MEINHECKKCGQCCRGKMGPIIFPSDVNDICDMVGVSTKNFLHNFCCLGKVVLKDRYIKVYYLKIINGACVFLDNNLCKIFPYRPYECRNAPYNFMAKYSLWSHMKCITEDKFENINSLEQDKKIFKQLLSEGYSRYERGN